LGEHPENLTKFLSLNRLQAKDPLVLGRAYRLPVYNKPFDGKSIRSTLGMTDYSRAKAIEDFNGLLLASGQKVPGYHSDRILWVPWHLERTRYANPGPKPEARFPIFGSYALTPIETDILRGKVFYLISGHGGPDPGAQITLDGQRLCEDEYAYDVALRLCRQLIRNGAMAYMITRDGNDGIRDATYLPCDRDETVWGGTAIPAGHRARLQQRMDRVRELVGKNAAIAPKGQFLLEFHIDSRQKKEQVDLYIYHQEKNHSSKAMGEKIWDTFRAKYRRHRQDGNYRGTLSARGLFTLDHSPIPAVYIELGNLHHAFDQKRFLPHANRQVLAEWFAEALKTENPQ